MNDKHSLLYAIWNVGSIKYMLKNFGVVSSKMVQVDGIR